jgi:hypothetical protein
MMLKTLTEGSCEKENDFLQYYMVDEDYFNLTNMRFYVRTCVLKFTLTLKWRQEEWIKGTAFTSVYRICYQIELSANIV